MLLIMQVVYNAAEKQKGWTDGDVDHHVLHSFPVLGTTEYSLRFSGNIMKQKRLKHQSHKSFEYLSFAT